jgi:hypothetical protein
MDDFLRAVSERRQREQHAAEDARRAERRDLAAMAEEDRRLQHALCLVLVADRLLEAAHRELMQLPARGPWT